MRLEYQIVAAIMLDMLIGDPRCFPHPVKLIGALASGLERVVRQNIRNEWAGGIITAFLVITITGGTAHLLLIGAKSLSALSANIASIVIIYFTLSIRDLLKHGNDVFKALNRGDIPLARRRVAMLVGRDTEHLDEAGIARAAVESVAENLTDGIAAPLFYAVLFGPVAAITYKAINTLDSMFGYKNERYLHFGWAAAKIDDVANFIPARLASRLIPVAAMMLRYRPLNSVKMIFRDGQKHPSPNSGLTESAVAGALGIELGGLSHYAGEPSEKPKIGDPDVQINRHHISNANALVFTVSLLVSITLLSLRRLF